MLKYLYIILGMVALCLGLLGLVTPGLPTTPFILLTAYLFAKGSPNLHQRLLSNKLTSIYINRVNNGLTPKALILSIALMWCMVSFTAFIVFDNGIMRFVMLGLAMIGTIAQILVLGKKRKKKLKLYGQKQKDDVDIAELS